jgi:hypothetical protein
LVSDWPHPLVSFPILWRRPSFSYCLSCII